MVPSIETRENTVPGSEAGENSDIEIDFDSATAATDKVDNTKGKVIFDEIEEEVVWYDTSESDDDSDDSEIDLELGGDVFEDASESEEEEDPEICYYSYKTRSGCAVRHPKEKDDTYVSEKQKKGKGDDLSVFYSERMPCEEKFIAGMTALHEVHCLNVDISAHTCGEAELHLVGATGTKYKNTKDLETVNYKGMMESPRKEIYEERIEVEHEKFVKYDCWDKQPRADLLPGDEVIDGTCALVN